MPKLDTKVNPCQTIYVRVVRGDCRDPSGRATLQLPDVSGLRTRVSGPSKSPFNVYQTNGYQPVKCPVKRGASQGIKVSLDLPVVSGVSISMYRCTHFSVFCGSGWCILLTFHTLSYGVQLYVLTSSKTRQVITHILSVAYQPLPGLSCLYRPVGVLRSKNVGE